MSDYETWAAGYASSPLPVDEATWTRWRREIENYARTHGLRLTDVFIERPSILGRPAEPSSGLDRGPELKMLVHLIRERAHLRTRHISVLLVPSIEHLAPHRDGTHDTVRNLMELHFGLRVHQVVTASPRPAVAEDAEPIPAFPAYALFGVPGSVPLAGRSQFQQILHGTARVGVAASEPASDLVLVPIVGRPVMTSRRRPDGLQAPGFQSPGFTPISDAVGSSPGDRSTR